MNSMDDLVERAREFATTAHQRINHQRKYSKQPYHVHLEAVAKKVASVVDDPEMVAAAWLHDTVEDTPATLEDIEEYFGASVAELVEELTDVSKPSDGNRVQRKAMDRRHSAQASARSKTVKLADLIDNCKDITKHDERFARVYLVEMGALLQVLTEGDQTLFDEATRLHAKHVDRLGIREAVQVEPELWEPSRIGLRGFDDRSFKRMFTEIFTARDIAEGLLSFDADTPCEQVARNLKTQRREVASIRISGKVQGYIRAADLGDGECTDCFRNFAVDQVLNGTATFSDVIHVLTRHDYCFVSMLGNVTGVIRRDDINKPMVRMWLFGIITMVEMGLVELIRERLPEGTWEANLSEGRLQKARDIQKERQRRSIYCDLLECLQLSDKAQVLIDDPVALARLGMASKSVAKRAVKELESLRNHLAHAQDIVMHDWPQIARLSMRMEEVARE
jgi:hypothetical protein